jgi:phage FluMu protein Com
MIDVDAVFRSVYCTECSRRVADIEEPASCARLHCPRCRKVVIAVLDRAAKRRAMVTA